MQGLSLIGGAISTAIGGFKMLFDHDQSDLMDVKYHDLTNRQNKIYQSQVNMTNDKRVLALNSLTENYGNSGFSTKGGTGAQESQAINTSFNNVINQISDRYQVNLQNLDYENQLAHQTQDLKYLSDFASMTNSITRYGKLYNEYTGSNEGTNISNSEASSLKPQASVTSNYFDALNDHSAMGTISKILWRSLIQQNEKYGLTDVVKNFIFRK